MLKELTVITMVALSAGTPKYAQRDMSAEIYAIQQRMQSLGYFNIKLTGIYGGVLENAYKQFQFSNGQEITGIITEDDLTYIFSSKAKPKLYSKRRIASSIYLSQDTFSQIDSRITESFDIKFETVNKTAVFKVQNSSGHLIGSLEKVDLKGLKENLRYPVIATIQGIQYPASLDFSGNKVHLHFKDSVDYLGIPDSEHQFNINKLLGL